MDFIVIHTQVLINSFGLILDIIGAYLLFKFGLPPSIDRTGVEHLVGGEIDSAEVKKGKLYDSRSAIGFKLLILGFVFQLVSNIL